MSSVEPLQALNLDPNQQQSFVRYFTALPEKPSTTIRIFNRTDFYSVHGDDATLAANEMFKTALCLKTMGTIPKLDYLVLSKNNFEKFLRTLLLVKHYQVEVYTNYGGAKNQDWKVEFKGSPGNLTQFEDILFETDDVIVNSMFMAVKLEKNNKRYSTILLEIFKSWVRDAPNGVPTNQIKNLEYYLSVKSWDDSAWRIIAHYFYTRISTGISEFLGVSCINTDEYNFMVCEFTDNEFFSHLESLIIQLGPKECLIQSNDLQSSSRLKMILQRSNILCTPVPKMDFSDSLIPDLNRLLQFEEKEQQSCNIRPEINLKSAMASLHAAINYLELSTDAALHGKYNMQILDTKRYVHLDYAAVNALNIFPKDGLNSAGKKNTSIYGLLDCCRTAHGRRMLAQWVKQPLRDINALTDRLDIVELFVNDPSVRDQLYNNHLRRIPDILTLAKKMLRKKARLQDIYRVYQAIDKLPQMVECLSKINHKTIKTYFVDSLTESIQDMDKFQSMVESTFDMEAVERGEYLVKPTFEEDLTELYMEKQKLEEKIQRQLSYAAKDLVLESGKTIKLDSNDQFGYFLRVTLKEEPILRKKKQYKVIGAVKGGVRFITSTLEELNKDYAEVKRSYEKQQQTLVADILGIAAGYTETLTNINYKIAQLDVLVSFANVTCTAPKQYVRPKLLPEGSGHIKLTQIRHPCLEMQELISFNPNDIEFKRDECIFHIVTGPNMGGKSTYIRSVGVAILMAQIGCFVPCDEAEISIVDCILSRVGSDDCEAKGLSTFMLEMVETAGILRTATENSLVIIDELGRGTSTYEGCGIAWSIAEHLAKEIKAFSTFATHFHEITKLADEIPTVINKYVTALISDNKLTLMYQVKPGICDQSFGIHIAKMAGFPQDFLNKATSIQHSLEDYRNIVALQKYDASKRQKILEEGDEIIRNVTDKYNELKKKRPYEETELEKEIKKIKDEVKNTENVYIKALIGC